MIITGIGSRKTPSKILVAMENFAREAADKGYIFRSGHAEGADYAFEKGAGKSCIVYLPWHGFNDNYPVLGSSISSGQINQEALDMVIKHEPHAATCTRGVQLIKCRNVYQVLGINMSQESDLVVCWTPGGNGAGGTGLAIKIADSRKIPVIDLGRYNSFDLEEDIDSNFIWRKVNEIIS